MTGESKTKPGRRLRPGQLVLWGLLFGVLIAELFFYTWVRMQCIGVGYEIGVLNKEQRRLTDSQDNLKVELARLKSPQRIMKIARETLGLTHPTSKQVLVMP